MNTSQINPTRMELQKLRDKLVTTSRGHKLLKDKQDELIHQFIPLLSVYRSLRERVEKALSTTLALYQQTAVKMDEDTINDQIKAGSTTYTLNADTERIMGVVVPRLDAKENESSGVYDVFQTTSYFDALLTQIKGLFSDLVELANLETTINILVAEIEKSKRRVNAIENIVIKEIEEQIKIIRMKLTDLERSNTIRMMKSKEIILNKRIKKEED